MVDQPGVFLYRINQAGVEIKEHRVVRHISAENAAVSIFPDALRPCKSPMIFAMVFAKFLRGCRIANSPCSVNAAGAHSSSDHGWPGGTGDHTNPSTVRDRRGKLKRRD